MQNVAGLVFLEDASAAFAFKLEFYQTIEVFAAQYRKDSDRVQARCSDAAFRISSLEIGLSGAKVRAK